MGLDLIGSPEYYPVHCIVRRIRALRLHGAVGTTTLASHRLGSGCWSGVSPAHVACSALRVALTTYEPHVAFLPAPAVLAP
jgi:hypothetical protein